MIYDKNAPIAYTYEADTHCPDCAYERFGTNSAGFITGIDDEGNSIGVIAPWDEWYELSEENTFAHLICGDCDEIIAEAVRSTAIVVA